jgi:serine/threonine protein kinase
MATLESRIASTNLKMVTPQILVAIEHMAARGIMHLGITPANIHYFGPAHIILANFAGAMLEDEAVQPLAPDNSPFTAPECHRLPPNCKADVFSAALVLLCVERKKLPDAFEKKYDPDTVAGTTTSKMFRLMLEPQPRQRITAGQAVLMYCTKEAVVARPLFHPCPPFQAAISLITASNPSDQTKGWEALAAMPGACIPSPLLCISRL